MVFLLRSLIHFLHTHPVRVVAVLFSSVLAGIMFLSPDLSSGSYRPASHYESLFPPPDSIPGGVVTKNQPGDPQFPSSMKSRTGGRSIGGASGQFSSPTSRASETPAFEDTTWVVYLDSTARLEQWNYKRYDPPQVQLFPDRVYPLFAQPTQSQIRYEVTADSAISRLHFRKRIGNEDVRIPVSLTLKDYIAERQKYERWKMFADEARKPKALALKKDISDVFSSFTKIQIPVPANPIMSIFGKPEINLQISGAVDIRAGFRSTKNDQQTINVFDQTRNEPDFNQEVQVAVNGTIGDKLNILADWNTQRTFEFENQLKIKYTGYEDEIVQSIEAGNVSLQTPSALIGQSAALFGIKAKFQTGPLTLTTIASQKKGQIKEVEAKGGAQENPFSIDAYDYATNYYFVDTSYRPLFEPYYLNDPATVSSGSQILEEEVWVFFSGNDQTQILNSRQAAVHIVLDPRPAGGYGDSLRLANDPPGRVENLRMRRLLSNEYELMGDGYIGVIALNAVSDQQTVGIAYRTADGRQYGDLSRDIPAQDTSRTFVLKMVKPKNLNSVGPRYDIAWKQMLKNIYSLRLRNIRKAGFELDVYRRQDGQDPVNIIQNERLLRVLGVDRFNADDSPAPNGDNVFDFRPNRTVKESRAEIIFPYLEPFGSGLVQYFQSLNPPVTINPEVYGFREIYDTTKTVAQQSIRNKYFIQGKATGETSSKYNLGFNVVEGSVRVYLRDRLLTPNVDYTVDYILGEVVIRNPEALVPGAQLQIKYEQNDLFQLASKTLFGARGDLFVSQSTNFGFTVLSLNQQSLSDKVRLGEEPNKNTIVGFDGQTTIKLPFLTSAIDALPGIQTRELSDFKLAAEAAYVSPDPNTRKSTISSDGGSGIAYIDDFEGSRRTIPLGTNYAQWFQASAPVDSSLGVNDTSRMKFKAKTIWYNVYNLVQLTDVYPDKLAGSAASNRLTVMDVKYHPTQRGMYNYNRGSVVDSLQFRNWGGIMRPISIAGTNLITENINFIEIWMMVGANGARPGTDPGKMYIDLGSISEDVIPNRRLNTEDLVPPSTTINNSLQPWEDVGLDMLTNAEELALYGDLNGDGDPSGDDYAYTPNSFDYSRINGTENNRTSQNGLYPDTEDLNSDGTLNEANSYFRYEISLDTVRARNPNIVGGGIGTSVYYQFRIPIREYQSVVGSPTFENVESIRLSFQNEADSVFLRIADFSLVGNQWQELDKEDPTFAVSIVGIEENSNIYASPPGVIRERDKTRPEEQIFANEQSLALILRGVPDGQSRQAVKYYTTRPLDLFNYRTMKMYVHGDEQFRYVDVNNYDAEFFFRFGADSLNYYEYRAPIHPASPLLPGDPVEVKSEKLWNALNNVEIRFQDLTAIKQGRDSLTQFVERVVPGGPPGAVYRVLGNPSLTQIRYMSVGVANPMGKGTVDSLFGQVWVNELRLIDVDDSPGWAYRFDASVKLADLGMVSFNYSKVDPNFHSIEQRFGSRQTGTNWGIAANVDFGKFFPSDWAGTTLPISYSHSEGLIRPKYLPSSDVLVSEAARLEKERLIAKGYSEEYASAAAAQLVLDAETYRTSDSWAAPNFRIALPSDEWWIRDTWNKLTFGFNYTKSRERNPTTAYRLSWQWSARIQYQLAFSPDYFIQPFKSIFAGLWFLDDYKDMKIWFAPQSFSWSLGANRSRDRSLQRTVGSQEQINRNFNTTRSLGFAWKLTEGGLLNLSGDYGLNVEASLLNLETDPLTNQQRRFSKILDDIFFNNSFINFGQDTRYSQRNNFSTRPNIPNIFNIKKYLDLSFGYSVDYNWQNTLIRGDLGKSAGWGNNITFSLNFRLKQLFDPLFESSAQSSSVGGPMNKGGRRSVQVEDDGGAGDTTAVAASDSTAPGGGGLDKVLGQLKEVARLLIKVPLLDYETVSVTFTQTNNAANSGVLGRPGFVNFWGRVPFFQESDPRYGPSRLYQLGLISDPHGRLTNFGTRPKFPFFGWDVEPGPRAASGTLQNTFRQTNRLSFKTSRGLWEGARLDLNWNVGWSYSSSENFTTDSLGRIIYNDPARPFTASSSGSVDRSFFTLPDFLFFGSLKSNLKEVATRYGNLSESQRNEEALAKAFEEGFEALPFFRKIFGPFTPRVNWSLRWDGLERLPMFESFVSRLSFDHSYASNYTRSFANRPGGGGERTEGQRVTYGFSPLVGLNFTFKDLLKGAMGANIRYNTNTTYDLAVSSRNIVETLSQEISFTASYSRRGFEIPFFGLSLNNDLEINASYSLTRNSRKQFEVARLTIGNVDGVPLEGSTRTILEPRIKYVLSQRVNASVYYRLTKITPDAQGSAIPGSTTNEAGLDIHISIQ